MNTTTDNDEYDENTGRGIFGNGKDHPDDEAQAGHTAPILSEELTHFFASNHFLVSAAKSLEQRVRFAESRASAALDCNADLNRQFLAKSLLVSNITAGLRDILSVYNPDKTAFENYQYHQSIAQRLIDMVEGAR